MARRPDFDPGWRMSIGLAVAAVSSAATIGAGIPDRPRFHQVVLLILAALIAPVVLLLTAPPPQAPSKKSLEPVDNEVDQV